MPTSAEVLVDTSMAIALLVADHAHHAAAADLLRGRTAGLAGHAAFESFSVLTRLPPPLRRTPASAARMLAESFPSTRFLDPGASARLLDELPNLGIAGGAVYDALVGAVARQHGLPLATRDARALATYRKLDVDLDLLG